MPASKIKHREKGASFEINAVADIIKIREAQGKDATFERDLLKHWSKHKGYESAKKVLDKLGGSK